MKKHILIVEDEKSLRRVLRDKLVLEGFTVSEAANGEEGLQMAVEERPDLILLDIVMPKMNGLEMFKRLRETPWGKTARAIILTNLGEENEIVTALEEGIPDYLVKKDWSLAHLVEKIRMTISEKRLA
ncbi:MAG: response regulator [Candidatus Moraniibacteriota bacterium]